MIDKSNDLETFMKIGAFAKLSGLSVDTIRYYEKVGLLKPPYRDAGGRRVFDEDELNWLKFLVQLKSTGMTVAQMVTYSNLRNLGGVSYEERQEMLMRQRKKVAEQLAILQECDKLLEEKITIYNQLIKEYNSDKPRDKSQKNS